MYDLDGKTALIARMAAFLASAESDYMTGLSVSVSGGVEMNQGRFTPMLCMDKGNF